MSLRTFGRRSKTRRHPRCKCDLQNKRLFSFTLSCAFHAVRRDSVFVSLCKRCEREEQRNKSIKGSIRESSTSSRSHITLPNQMGVRQSLHAHTPKCAHTHTHKQAIAQKQKKLSLLSASVPFIRRQWASALMSLRRRLLCKQIQMWWWHVTARTSGRDEEWHWKLDCSTSFYSNFDAEQSRSTLREKGEGKKGCRPRSLSTVINRR